MTGLRHCICGASFLNESAMAGFTSFGSNIDFIAERDTVESDIVESDIVELDEVEVDIVFFLNNSLTLLNCKLNIKHEQLLNNRA